MISWTIYELLTFGFQNVNGFSSPQAFINKQLNDFHEIYICQWCDDARMSLGVEKSLPSDCLNVNEFRAIHMNTHSSEHVYL